MSLSAFIPLFFSPILLHCGSICSSDLRVFALRSAPLVGVQLFHMEMGRFGPFCVRLIEVGVRGEQEVEEGELAWVCVALGRRGVYWIIDHGGDAPTTQQSLPTHSLPHSHPSVNSRAITSPEL